MRGDHALGSVVMPFLNATAFIQGTLERVFAQTYDRWELLLVDDGSADARTAMARRCAHQYPEKVCYVEHEAPQHRGVSASRHLSGSATQQASTLPCWMPMTCGSPRTAPAGRHSPVTPRDRHDLWAVGA
jgi:hypothetical protein